MYWVKRQGAATRTALVAHALSWAAFLWLLLWPYSYRGVSVTVTAPEGPPGVSIPVHASMVAFNGLKVIPILAIPVAITALLLAVVDFGGSRKVVLLAMWPLVVLLLAFCALGAFSVGPLYLPAALAAVVAAVLLSLRQRASATRKA